MNRACCALAAAFVTILTVPAVAAETTASSMVRKKIERLLDRASAKVVQYGRGGALDYGLDVTETQDGRIETVVRGVSLRTENRRWDAGDIILDLTPLDDGRYAVSLVLPSAVVERDYKGQIVAALSVGDRQFTGIYDLKRDIWLSVDGTASSVVFRRYGKKNKDYRIEMDRASLSIRLDEAVSGKLSGSAAVRLYGLSAAGDGMDIRLGEADIGYAFGGLDNSLFGTATPFDRITEGTPVDKGGKSLDGISVFLGAVLGLIREGIPPVDSVGLSLNLGDLSWSVAKIRGAIDSVTFDVNGKTLASDRGSLHLIYDHDGLNVGVEGLFADVIPRTLKTVLVLDGIPAMEAMETLFDIAGAFSYESWRVRRGRDSRTEPFTLLEILTRAGSVLRIERLTYESPTVRGTVNGALNVSSTSPNMIQGEITIVLRGLHDISRRIEARARNGESGAWKELAAVSLLWVMGVEVSENGEVRHEYILHLTPQGSLLIGAYIPVYPDRG